jgi:membrane protein DedA with SNARE-associated domain
MNAFVDLLLRLDGPMPYVFIFLILLACGLGLPMPEDIILIAGGLAAYYEVTSLWATILVSYAGVLIGDGIIFYLGYTYGPRVTKIWFFRKLLAPKTLEHMKDRLAKSGYPLIFFARFMPGLRAPIFFTAGTLHLPFRVFLFFDGLAALLSVPLIVYVVYRFGDQLERVVKVIKRVEHGIVACIVLGIVVAAGRWYVVRRKRKRPHP